jgi:hypothetical protein
VAPRRHRRPPDHCRARLSPGAPCRPAPQAAHMLAPHDARRADPGSETAAPQKPQPTRPAAGSRLQAAAGPSRVTRRGGVA